MLVTGGAGFIGSHYVRQTLAGTYPNSRNTQITVLDKLTYAGNRANLPDTHPRLTFIHGDVADQVLLQQLLPGHDAVIHFAAETHVDRSISGPAPFVDANIVGTHNLMQACLHADVSPILYVSTDEVYGSISHGSWTEERPLQPNSPYAASKASGEMIARSYWRTYGLDVRVTRCCNNYGPYQHIEKLIPLFVTNLLANRPVPLYGDGHNVREWLHVDDHCRALHLVITGGKPGDIYNIGSGTALTNRQMTGRLLELCGADWTMVRHVTDRNGHDYRYALNATKIRTELGFGPRIGFSEGLADVVCWYRNNPAWWEPMINQSGIHSPRCTYP
jgi:dTDP-glucose 4,6-dehydratase